MRTWWKIGIPVLALTALPLPAHASSQAAARPPAACSPHASLIGFSDALDKTTFAGTQVAGAGGE
jgi:hypothetical protein